MAVEIQVVESGLVGPSEETPKHSLWLSNLDLLVARAHVPTIYFYRQDESQNGDFFSPEAMKVALSKALVHFYPLAGRLELDASGRVQIQCTGEGVLFVVARSESAVDEFGEFEPSDEMRRLLVPSAPSGTPPCILVMLQLTFFKCGGVCLGAAVHHTAADGLGALHFMNSWSEIARGTNKLSVSPYIERTLLRAREPPSITSEHIEYAPKPLSEHSAAKCAFDSAILKLTKTQVESIKHSVASGKKPLSSFKAVVSHLWRSACKARKLINNEATHLYITADARTRIKPQLPQGYLGNAIFRASAVANAGEIIGNELDFSAEIISKSTDRLNDEHIRSLIDFLELQEDVRGLAKGAWVMPETDLWIISWQGLPIYDADFGWGKPVFMGRACLQFAGLVYIMNNPGDKGGLLLAVGMEPENMLQFKKIFYEDLGCA
ncbi:LOW QUALITY PROTEIN: putrescine hydroxycinnamoyltransferase 1-like [Dioscorea cayenensis subsp. rotundata]|uniref:LOW QUALITY PROTEIN: putrescine hydroxycinnamoyltransferase 1-like n=1 Tax=Dioscorea cayennensis subsp. rotundata TaxID=55577 RepID=A0AB40ASD9_DIOCR|nr:LOW QUALITY PROTEIN: putrescine hydroxycinnamoyltransferase 1-like [Dioscorea cayenensis subsp. rotundata]